MLNQAIAKFYDRSTPLWLDTWGEHMHHGWYGPKGQEKKDHRQAQIDLAEELLKWGGIEKARQILDAGCGVGGSARLLARKFEAQVLGLTLSPVQAKEAANYNRQAGLDKLVTIEARDVMTLDESVGSFDLIWSMESAEHMPDKGRLLEIFYKRLKPGGKFLMATWCHRELPPELSTSEKKHLNRICERYHLPPWVAISDYTHLAKELGFTEVRSADWSAGVAPFWGAVIRSAISLKSFTGLLKAGWPTLRGAWAMRDMVAGYRRGLIKFGVIQGQRP